MPEIFGREKTPSRKAISEKMESPETWTAYLWEKFYERQMRAVEKKKNNPGNWIDASRIRPLIRDWVDMKNREMEANASAIHRKDGSNGGLQNLAFRSGIPERALYRIMHPNKMRAVKRQGGVSFDGNELYLSLERVEQLFYGMECEHLFYHQPTNEDKTDGFADVYFHPSVMEKEAA